MPPGVDWRSARDMVPRAREIADAVFLGRVVAVDTLQWGTFTWPADGSGRARIQRFPETVRYTFAATRRWKGSVNPQTRVTVTGFSTSCGRSFGLDSTYLVYASGAPSASDTAATLGVDVCGRVRREHEAAEDLALLGRGTPVPP